jgi:hypothetical protein
MNELIGPLKHPFGTSSTGRWPRIVPLDLPAVLSLVEAGEED